MKERPILFNAPMVRALLDGSKTQTRRVVKQPHQNPLGVWEPFDWGGENGGRDKHGNTTPAQQTITHTRTGEIIACPHGQPGDRLWVRETWANVGTCDPGLTVYRADYPACVPCAYENVPPADTITWKPSIHMFRKDSRITLEITGVRVERLQDISEADALAEGIKINMHSTGRPMIRISGKCPPVQYAKDNSLAVAEYASLWDTINGPNSWAANPWVWVIEFKVLQK